MGILASLGIGWITDMVKDKGEELVTKGIEKVTGIKLADGVSEEDKALIQAELGNIQREVEMMYADKQSARDMSMKISTEGKDWLVRNTGSMIALAVVVSVFTLFTLLVIGTLDIANSTVAMIVGFAGGYVTQILSFYFGSSKEQADDRRK